MVVKLMPALLGAILLLAAPAQALYDDVELTEVISDSADHVDFLDIQSIAVGEPGDGTFLFKIQTAGNTLQDAAASIAFFFEAGGSSFAMGSSGDGGVYANGNINPQKPDQCTLDGAAVYCWIVYDKLGVTVGDQVTSTYSISYVGGAQDFAPGEGGFHNSLLGNRGLNYQLVGCTMKDPADCPGAAVEPEPVDAVTRYAHLDEGAGQVDLVFDEPTGDTYVYNWTTGGSAVNFTYLGDLTQGTVTVSVVDPVATEVLNVTMDATYNATVSVDPARAGNWTITMAFADFVGNAAFDLEAIYAEGEEPPQDDDDPPADDGNEPESEGPADNDDGHDGNMTDDGTLEEDSPGVGVIAPLALVGLAGYLRKRRT